MTAENKINIDEYNKRPILTLQKDCLTKSCLGSNCEYRKPIIYPLTLLTLNKRLT